MTEQITDLVIPGHMSYSQVNTLTTCSYQWYLGRGRKVPEQPNWGGVGGNAVHTATERYDWALHEGVELTDTELDDVFHLVFDEEIAKRERYSKFTKEEFHVGGRKSKEWPDKENEDWWRANGPTMVRSWKAWRRVCPWELAEVPDAETGELVPAIEVGMEVDLGSGPVKAFIDRVFVHQGNLIVLDLKSNAREPESAKQLGLYAVMFAKTFGDKPASGVFWMGRTGSTSEVKNLTGYTEERFAYEFDAARRVIEARAFVPKESALCRGCGVRKYCYAVGGEYAGEVNPW